MPRISVFIEEIPPRLLTPSPMSGHKKEPAMNQKEEPLQTMKTPRSHTFSPRILRNEFLLPVSLPICGALL